MPMSDADARKALFDLILNLSFGRRDIILASGRPSTFYFDLKPTMLNPQGASLIAQLALKEILNVSGEFVGGLEMGAVPITGAIIAHSYEMGTPVGGFFVRKAPKGHGTKKVVEGLPDGQTMAGRRIVILDDTTTTAGSAIIAAAACREQGAEIALALSIVDRAEGAAEALAAEGIPQRSLFTAAEFLAVR